MSDGIRVFLFNETYLPYGAHIFVSGQNNNPYCSKTFPRTLLVNQSVENLSQQYFHIPIAHCNMELESNVCAFFLI